MPPKKRSEKNGRNVSVSIAANYFATLRPISFVRMHNIQPFLTDINGLIQFFCIYLHSIMQKIIKTQYEKLLSPIFSIL